ncbi:MAG: RNA-binding S4 domain-containing protein [Ignavibacteriae bacterium]|nr:MAG: RNA-binding S4 domain-containing protein [Ignavibacteriota bacterium]
MRIDKWLWAVRVFKSRTLATEACGGGKVKIDNKSIKPSRDIKPDEVVTVQSGPVKKTYRVKGLLEKRSSAKIAAEYVQDITPPEEKLKEEIAHRSYIARYKGAGRPTKKERRTIDKIRNINRS